MSKTFRRFVVAAILVAAATPAVLGAEGRIPIWAPVVIGPGAEGKYIVTRDVFAFAGSPVVTILPGTAAVDIDLNGFTLWGNAADVINATGVDSLTVRNGTLIGGINGIWATQCRKVVVEDVKIQVVQSDGIALMDVISFAVRRNIIQDAIGNGINIDGAIVTPGTTTTGAVDDNAIYRAGRGIQLYNGSSVGIQNNRIETTTTADGIFISAANGIIGCGSCLVANNTIQEARANGMWLSNFRGGKIHNNEIISAGFNQGGEGIWLDVGSDHNLLLDNVLTECGRNGMLVLSNGNHIERNVLNRNGVTFPPAWGLFIQGGASNTYRGNTAQFNPGIAVACPGFPATTDICVAGAGNNSPGDNFMPNAL